MIFYFLKTEQYLSRVIDAQSPFTRSIFEHIFGIIKNVMGYAAGVATKKRIV